MSALSAPPAATTAGNRPPPPDWTRQRNAPKRRDSQMTVAHTPIRQLRSPCSETPVRQMLRKHPAELPHPPHHRWRQSDIIRLRSPPTTPGPCEINAPPQNKKFISPSCCRPRIPAAASSSALFSRSARNFLRTAGSNPGVIETRRPRPRLPFVPSTSSTLNGTPPSPDASIRSPAPLAARHPPAESPTALPAQQDINQTSQRRANSRPNSVCHTPTTPNAKARL